MAEKSLRALSTNNKNNPFVYPNYKLDLGFLLQQYSCAQSQCFWHCHTQTLTLRSSLQPTSISFGVFLHQKMSQKEESSIWLLSILAALNLAAQCNADNFVTNTANVLERQAGLSAYFLDLGPSDFHLSHSHKARCVDNAGQGEDFKANSSPQGSLGSPHKGAVPLVRPISGSSAALVGEGLVGRGMKPLHDSLNHLWNILGKYACSNIYFLRQSVHVRRLPRNSGFIESPVHDSALTNSEGRPLEFAMENQGERQCTTTAFPDPQAFDNSPQ